MSKHGVFPDPYFPFSQIQTEHGHLRSNYKQNLKTFRIICMCTVKTKILKTHLCLSNISLLSYLSQAILKLRLFKRLHKRWIYKSH